MARFGLCATSGLCWPFCVSGQVVKAPVWPLRALASACHRAEFKCRVSAVLRCSTSGHWSRVFSFAQVEHQKLP